MRARRQKLLIISVQRNWIGKEQAGRGQEKKRAKFKKRVRALKSFAMESLSNRLRYQPEGINVRILSLSFADIFAKKGRGKNNEYFSYKND